MSKRVLTAYMKRTLAFLLTAVMVFSTVDSTSLSAYATGEGDVVVTEVVEETTEVVETEMPMFANEPMAEVQPMAEEDELAYTGSTRTEDGNTILEISAWELENNSMEVTDATFISILGAQTETFNTVELNMSGASESISMDLWNAAVAVLTTEEGAYTAIRYNQSGENEDMNWNFENPGNAEAAIAIGVTYTIGGEGEGITFNFANTSIPAESCFNIYSDENRTVYSSMLTALGEDGTLKIFDGDTALDNVGVNKDINTFTEEDVEKYGINISIVPVHNLTAGTNYVVKSVAYTGTLEENEDGWASLYIRPGEAGKEEFTADEVVSILQANAGASVNEIYIEYPDQETKTISGIILNEAVNYLKEATEDFMPQVIFAYRNNDTASTTEFKVNEPFATEEPQDVTVDANIAIGEDVKASVNVPEVSAQSVSVYYGFDNGSDAYTTLNSRFGDGWYEMEASGVTNFVWYDCSEWGVGICIDDANNLVSDTEYTITKKVYRGTVENREDIIQQALTISYQEAGVESFTEDGLNTILDNYSTDDGIGAVYIEQPRLETNMIYKSVANKAAALITNEYGQIIFAFRDTNTEQCVEWALSGNPTQMVQTADQNVNADIYVSEANEEHGDELVLSVAEQSLVAENVDVNFFTNRKNELETADEYIIGLFGEENIQLETAGGEIEGWYNVDEWNVCMGFHNPGALTPGEGYTIVKKIYKGTVDSRDEVLQKALTISYQDAGVESLDEAAILAILEHYATAGETFDCIEIINPETDTMVIDKDIVNVAASLFKTEGEVERPLSFNFRNEESKSIKSWMLINPTANQEADQTVTSTLTISEDNKVEIQAGTCTFSAEKYQIGFGFESDSENYEKLREKFPFDDDSWTMLAIGEDAFGAFMPNQERADIVVYIDPDTVWSADKVYEVDVPSYSGKINVWDDGTKELWIGFGEAGVESFTEEQLNGILDNYSTEDGIGVIYIEQPRLENNLIYKTVADKAASLIAGEHGEVKFAFRDTNTEQCVEWALSGNPSKMVQTEDQNVNAGIYISEENEEHGDELVLSVAKQSLVAENVDVNFFTNRENELETADEYIIKLFGEEFLQLETAGGEIEGWYSVDEWNVCMGFHNPGALTPGEGYTIIKKEYRGDVWENTDEEGNVFSTILHLNSDMVGLETWTPEAFEKTIQYWLDKGITFDGLNIEQKYTSNNVIQKDILNTAISLLSNPDEQMIEFVFCQCIMEEQDDEGNVTQEYSQCEYIWALQGPKTATKDINANVALTNKKGAGLSVVLPTNTYASEHTYIQFWMDNKATMFEEVLVPVFGYPENPEENFEAGQLLVLEKGTSLKFEENARYDGDGQYVNLYLSNIEEWTTKIDNRLIRPIQYESAAAVEKAIPLPIFGNLNPNNPNEDYTPAKDGKFTVLTPDVATLEGNQFTATVPDRTAYTLYSYTSVKNEPCLEVLRINTIAEVLGLSFMEDTQEIVWDGSESQEGYLEVKVSPASIQNRVNQQDFDWEIVSGDSIVLKEAEYETYYDEETGEDVTTYRKNGEFSVVGYGETVVKVSYGECSATCTVNVMTPVMVPDIPVITAIPAVDVTLGDVDVDALIKEKSDNTFEGTFAWQDSTTKLAPFADNGWHTFGATYTVEGREPVPVTICVDMLKIENIEIWDMEKDENGNFVLDEPGITGNPISVGDEVVYGFQVVNNRFDGTNIYGDSVLQRYVENGDIVFKWTDKETLNLLDADHDANTVLGLARSYTANKKGKKTFKIAAVNAKTNKEIASNSITILVTEKDLFSFDYDVFAFGDDVDPDNNMNGTYTISVDPQNYANAKKLTIKSGDTSVLKLGRISVKDTDETTSGLVEITIPYEFKKYGETVLKITASDEAKTSKVIPVERVDYEPRPSLDSYTIDKSWTIEGEYKPETILNIAFQHDTLPTGIVTIKETEYRDLFILDGSMEGAWYEIKLANANVDKGTYKLTLQIPYSINGQEQTPVEKVIKVKVQESKVKVKVKQTKKVNEFYDLAVTSEGDGVLTVNSGKHQVRDAYISNEDSVFELNRIGEYEFALDLKDGVNLAGEKLTAEQKNVQVTYSVVAGNGAVHENTVNVSVKTENKAPQLVLSLKNDTLYPHAGQNDAVVQILDKKTKEQVDISGHISLVDKKSGEITNIATVDELESAPYEYLTIGKNQYFVYSDYNEIRYYLYDAQSAVKATDKAVLRVQKEGWNGYVDLNYAIKVDLSIPKVVLANKTLTLNANNDLYRYQIAKTDIKIKNLSTYPYVEEGWVTGVNEKSNAALKNNLNIHVIENMLVAKIVDKGNEADGTLLKNGSYKFKVWTMINGQKYSTDLTVKIVDKAPEKVVKVTKKGSIDVLRRGSTQITMNPKFTNVSGELYAFWLEGPDADMFDAYIDENGDCVVKAKENYEDEDGNRVVFNFSTKHNYQVKPVYVMEDWMVGTYNLEGSLQKIKVTQGKPKVTVDCSTNALYGDKSYGALFTFDAMLKDEYIAIESVELLNYTEDLIWDSENNILQVNTDADPVEITKASGKYTIKFAITYMDAAGNEKATQVSYKLNIVR